MFFLKSPSADQIREFIASQQALPFTYPEVGATLGTIPGGYTFDHNRVKLGHGRQTYERAIEALRQWRHFDLGWAKIVPELTAIAAGTTVAMLARHLGFRSLNACRIVYVIDDQSPATKAPLKWGFAYGTLPDHAECGEERFTIEWHSTDDSVWYDLLAFSRPKKFHARAGYPYARFLQKRFARESLRAMKRVVEQVV